MTIQLFQKWFQERQPQKSGSRLRPRYRVYNYSCLTAIYDFRLRYQHRVYVRTLSEMQVSNAPPR